MLLASVLAAAPPATPASAASAAAETATPARVIVHYDGRHRLCGVLEADTPEGVTVRDESGVSHQIERLRVVAVEPLLNLPAPAEGIVQMTDGRRFRGVLRRDGCDAVDLLLHDVPLQITRDKVAAVWLLEPVHVRHAAIKPMMPVDRPGPHLSMCRWLISEGAWDLAVTELEDHTTAHRSVEAARLLKFARAQQTLANSDAPVTPAGDVSTKLETIEPVDDAAVNLVRVYEVDFDDPPPLRIDRETRAAFLDAYATSALLPPPGPERDAVRDGDPLELLKLMFAHRAREFYGRVQVLDEPDALRRFRQSVHDAWLLPRCGMRACHGGPNAGRFTLVRGGRIDDRIRTSNLLLLEALSDQGRPMIDWASPERSLLIQHALPRDVAEFPHPPVSGWRPAMEAVESHRGELTVEWIESMMSDPRPAYPVAAPALPAKPADDAPRMPR